MKEILKSKTIIAFIIFILGITLISGLQDSTKKDLEPANSTSLIRLNYQKK